MVKYYNWWSNPDTERWFEEFLGHILSNFTDDVKSQLLSKLSLYSVFGPLRVLDNTQPQNINIVFIGENCSRLEYQQYQDYKYLSQRADLVLGFQHQPHEKRNILRFPLWLTYIPFYKSLSIIDTHIELCKQSINRPLKAVLVCSHDRTGIRTKCVSMCTTKKIDTDIGGHYSKSNLSIGNGNAAKHQLLKQYAINICPENSVAPGYTTEKIFQAIEAGCIPLYDGNRPVEPDVLNQQRILYYDNMNDIGIPEINRLSTMNPYQPRAPFWIMKYYLDMWAKIWYISVQKGLNMAFNKDTISQENVHHYFIIPYRNRKSNLSSWLTHARNTYFKGDKSIIGKFDVILVEQANNNPFNKGTLLNVGFWKAMELHHTKYTDKGVLGVRPNLIFNDVDVFCKNPHHLRVEPYVRHPYGQNHCLGCIFVCSPEAYLGFNGFSNSYNGWGREDADALLRCSAKGILVDRTGHQPRNSDIDFREFNHEADRTSIRANLDYYSYSNTNRWVFEVDGVNTNEIVRAAVNSELTLIQCIDNNNQLPYHHCKVDVSYQLRKQK